MISIREYFRTISDRLGEILGSKGEASAAAYIIFEDVAGYSKTFIFADGDREITPSMQARILAVVDRIATGEPVQYAVGRAKFMGNDFIVNPSVLIPRPETAGLVDMITDKWSDAKDLNILDIGTGSGCIALSLARSLPFSHVTGIDVSRSALEVARQNAAALKISAVFRCEDILTAVAPVGYFDIVVSNPPYVTDSEAHDMDARVLDYEPHEALFVPDDNPFKFYKAIATYAGKALKNGGMLYLEINQNFPEQMKTLVGDYGFTEIEVSRDFKGNYRYLSAVK